MKHKTRNRITVALIFVAAVAGTASAQNAGKDIFTSKCSICHSPDGSGNTSIGKNLKIRDLRSPDVQKQSDDDFKAIVTKGKEKTKMLAFADKLTGEQIDQVVAYMRELGKKK
jgi:mono/diheme cytochrome c family protein